MKKLTQLFFAAILLLYSLPANAQREYNTWYFGDSLGLDFNNGFPEELPKSSMWQVEGSASISHPTTGELLFYTNGINVWNKQHQVMPNGKNLLGALSSTQSALIVPKPGDSTKYYLLTADEGGYWLPPHDGINYSIIDMSRDGGLGDVDTTKKNISLLKPATEKLAAISRCDEKGVWVIAHGWDDNKYYAWHVSDTGISTPVVSSVGTVVQGRLQNKIGYIRFSSDGKKFAATTHVSGTVEIFDFDFATGNVSNPLLVNKKVDTLSPWCAEFSPNNSLLYVTYIDFGDSTQAEGYYSALYQYDLRAGGGDPDSIQNSGLLIAENIFYVGYYFALRRWRDGKIYVSQDVDSSLGIIENPNSRGAACSYQKKGFTFKNGYVVAGLPNFIDEAAKECQCKNYTLRFSRDSQDCGFEIVLTNFADSGIVNGMRIAVLNSNATVKNASGPWGIPNVTSKGVFWNIPSPGLPRGNSDSLFAYFSPTGDSLLTLRISWIAGMAEDEKELCVDTVTFSCKMGSVGISDDENISLLPFTIYPDPARENATFSFSLHNPERVSLAVMDILGKEVLRVVDGRLFNEGNHTITAKLSGLPTGVYACTLRISSYSQSKLLRIVR